MAHPAVHRTLRGLSVAYALTWATVSMVAGPGSAALVNLSGDLSFAGLFIGLFAAAAALGAAAGGRAMDRWGRKPVLMLAAVVSAVGFAVAGLATDRASFGLFVAGVVVLAFGFGAVNLARVAAAEIFPPFLRGRGIAQVQVSATIGAVIGPLFLIGSDPLGALLGRHPLTLVWFLAPPLLILAVVALSRIMEPARIAADLAAYHEDLGPVPPVVTPVYPTGLFVGATVALAASQASMVAVMGVAGAAVQHAGHGVVVLGILMFLHFVGMFGLSRIVGRIADRLGRRTTILSGLAALAAGGGVIAAVPGVYGFGVGLLLVGLGWSFGFIGATVLLTDITAPARRARILGRADLVAQMAGAIVATAAGYWFAVNGMAGLGILAILVVALPFVAMLAFREGRPGEYRQVVKTP